MPFLTVTGARAHYVHRQPVPASRPPVLFVHGAGGTHQHWLYQVRELSRAPTYAPDLPGHGRSKGPGRDGIQAYGDWLIAFLDTAGLEGAVLVGHSMGGAIALDLASRYPQRVLGLGLVATGARLRVAPAILAGVQEDTEAAVRLICDWAFGPEAPPEMVRLGRRQMGTTPAGVLYGDLVACDDYDVMGRLGEIATPTFVLCGTRDQLTPSKYSVYLRDHIAGAKLHLVEGAGHMVMVEKPIAVIQALSTLLHEL
jgi:pimeloyl-ACP methyl ester carboxylesterase